MLNKKCGLIWGGELDDRKLKILAAIVDEYILTGEPVGSKVIMNKLDIKISAATIRNEMATLEHLGYLEQPHTSAGRVPTFNGFRLYIDKVLCTSPLSDEEKAMLDSMIEADNLTEEGIIEQASNALAEITKCLSVATTTVPKFSVISKVEVIPTGRRLYVLLMITTSGNVKNKVCRLEFDLTDEQLQFFTEFMNENLEGVALDNISDELMQKLILAMGTYMMTLTPLVSGIYQMSQDLMEEEVVLSGEKNLLTCKDFDQNEIIEFIENKKEFTKLLDESFNGLHVMFSKENDTFAINNSSIITSTIKKGDKNVGTLGVIGPMRLDYKKIIPYIEYFSNKVSELLTNEEDENDENKKGG